jgi:hypothetical protein
MPVCIHRSERLITENDGEKGGDPPVVRMVPPAEIRVDAARFQFRLSCAADGTTGRLEACPCYRIELSGALLVWIDPSDGSGPWLIDGHHRRRLALEDGAPLVPVLLVDAPDAAAARTWGAMANVAAGNATATDLCRLLRDQALDPRNLARTFGIQRNAKVVADARTLLELEPVLFSSACTGELPLDQALALAVATDHPLQLRLWCMATDRCWTPEQTLEAAHLAQLAPASADAPSDCIPGLEALMREANTLLDQQLVVRATVRRLLRLENRAARVVGQHRAAAALERRNVATIDTQAAQEVKAESSALLQRFALLCGHSGPLAALLTQLSQAVADGGDPVRVVEAEMDEVRRVLSAELG